MKRADLHTSSSLFVQTSFGELQLESCNTFWKRFMGLMFRSPLTINQGLYFPSEQESILNASIHMLFMRFSIAVFWLNQNSTIIDKTIARPWHLAYFPASPACGIIEAHVDTINEFQIGDTISFYVKN